jgi:hypothetical protein
LEILPGNNGTEGDRINSGKECQEITISVMVMRIFELKEKGEI